MLSYQMTDNINKDFIHCMIPHHQAAISMCENLLQYTTYVPLIEIANGIITVQTREIEEMTQILKTLSNSENKKEDVYLYIKKYKDITRDMIEKMRDSLKSYDVNLDFISEMIPHHEGAIAMCQNLLQYNVDPRLRILAQTIVEQQTQGVEQLKNIRSHLIQR